MELHQLQGFVTVAQERSFSRAARLLHVAQPALSRKIRHLEDELNVTLLTRSANAIALTEPGRRFLQDAQRILLLCTRSVETARRLTGKGKKTVGIGYTTFLHYRLVMNAATTYLRSHTEVALNILDMSVSGQLFSLEHGAIDVGLIFAPGGSGASEALTAEVICHHEMLVALSASSPLAKKQFIGPKDLRLIPTASPLTSLVDTSNLPRDMQGASVNGFAAAPQIEDALAALSFVEAGLGAAVLPQEAMNFPHEDVVFLRFKPAVSCSTLIIWRRNEVDRSILEFIDILRDAIVPNDRQIAV